MDLFSLLYYDTVDIKAYDEVENNRPPTHAKNILCHTTYSIVQKFSNKQSVKVICRFDIDLEQHTVRDKQAM